MEDLASQNCVPCRGGVAPLSGSELQSYLEILGQGWILIQDHHLEHSFQFASYSECLAFTNNVAALAEEQNHHPDILLAWGKVTIRIWTHKIDGLTPSDFILAAKITTVSKN